MKDLKKAKQLPLDEAVGACVIGVAVSIVALLVLVIWLWI